MAREKENYRRNLERLLKVFDGKDVLNLKEVAAYMRTDKDVLLRADDSPFEKIGGKWLTTIMALANWLP